MELVWIGPGTFTMGSADFGPQHAVTISRGFWLGKYEMTQQQWVSVTDDMPSSGCANVAEGPDYPIVAVTWYQVFGLLSVLNAAEGREVYRLPTEAEWEYACRAGTTTRWSSGDDEAELTKYAWYRDGAGAADCTCQLQLHPVGTKLPNRWGLFDMHGNAWEWVQDWYAGYASEPQTDPQGAAGSYVVGLRGGSWVNEAAELQSAARWFYAPSNASSIVGLRLVRTD